MKTINKDLKEVKQETSSPNLEEKIKKAVRGEVDKPGTKYKLAKLPKSWNIVEADRDDSACRKER